jgi:GAF domain-containing protein
VPDPVVVRSQALCQRLVDEVGYQACWIGLALADGEAGTAFAVRPGSRKPLGQPFGQAPLASVLEQPPLVLTGIMDGAPKRLRQWVRDCGCLSAAVTPLTAGKERIGVMVICGNEPDDFTEDEVALWQTLADNIGALLRSG